MAADSYSFLGNVVAWTGHYRRRPDIHPTADHTHSRRPNRPRNPNPHPASTHRRTSRIRPEPRRIHSFPSDPLHPQKVTNMSYTLNNGLPTQLDGHDTAPPPLPSWLKGFLVTSKKREDVAAWEATPNREAQPSSLQAPSDAVDADLTIRTAEKVGFLAAKSPLPPTTLGNLVKRWRTRGQSASDLTPEMRPTGSAAGNTGRAKR